jgi:hypothetical protein
MTIITTTLGDMDDSLMDRVDGSQDTPTELVTWVEYRLKGQEEIIHRSVAVTVKLPVEAGAVVGQ